jgi:DNA-directed RNA polymerase beta' subunit
MLLYKELAKFHDQGIRIDLRYFSLFADLLASRGSLSSLGRRGVMNTKPPLTKASFESTKTVIYQLALSQKKDFLCSPTSAAIVGKPLRMGGNYFDLYF